VPPWWKTVQVLTQVIILFKYGCSVVFARSLFYAVLKQLIKISYFGYFAILRSVLNLLLLCAVVILELTVQLSIQMSYIFNILLVFMLHPLTFR
jgi:hypothetical protein